MNQYCRYCTNMVCGDANYCTVKEKTYSDNAIKSINHCKDFDFNKIDALGETDGYKPRNRTKLINKNQISFEV